MRSWSISCIVEWFQLLGVYLSVNVTFLCVWKLRHVVTNSVLQAVTCLKRVKLKRYAECCYRLFGPEWHASVFARGWVSVIWCAGCAGSMRGAVIVPRHGKSIFHPTVWCAVVLVGLNCPSKLWFNVRLLIHSFANPTVAQNSVI